MGGSLERTPHRFHIDNFAVVSALATETNRLCYTMALLCQILTLAAFLDFTFHSSWLSSTDNVLADVVSHFSYSQLFQHAPYLNKQPSPTNPHLSGMRPTLNCLTESYSPFAMASLLAHIEHIAPAKTLSSISSHSSPIHHQHRQFTYPCNKGQDSRMGS